MLKLNFVGKRGAVSTVETTAGTTVLQAAIDHHIDGLLGECGGACQCATCHVYVDGSWISRLPAADEGEIAMLDCTVMPSQPASRLGCQVVMSAELDGLLVRVAERQV